MYYILHINDKFNNTKIQRSVYDRESRNLFLKEL